MKIFGLILGALLSTSAFASSHFCAGQVSARAAQLFNLHYQPTVEESAFLSYTPVVQRQSLRSPDNKRDYAVLETTALVGKMGQFRIRLIYAVLGKTNPQQDCHLMGQEILDLSSL